VYSGSRFYVAGRYKKPGATSLSIAGTSAAGPQFFDYALNLTPSTSGDVFAQNFWAKEKIDDLERTIDVYGERDSLKALLITLSLRYGIRCRYTAYIADKTEAVSAVADHAATQPAAYRLLGNYPNPFNPATTVSFEVGVSINAPIAVRIYNALGQLVAVLWITVHGPGRYDVTWAGVDLAGQPVPSGVYIYAVHLPGGTLFGKMILVR
jgi:hypothetical protein